MRNRPLAAVLTALLLLSSPTAALAQSAGDDQYEDPFAGQGDPSGGGGEPTQPAEPAPGTSAAPATSGSAGAEADAAAGTSASGSDGRSELPRTGLEAPLVAMLGSGLLLAGAGLRLRVRADERRPV
jgi:hypothetical protein